MVAGNLGSLGFSEPTGFAISRLLVGIGAGTMISLGFTILGLTRDTDRNFGIMVMSVNLYGALVMIMMPTIYSVIGMHGLLIFFTLFASLAFLCVGNLPASAAEHIHIEADSITAPAHFRGMAAASVFMFFIGVGSIWTYLFLIGTNGGGTEQQVANAITLSQFMAAAGGLAAALVAARLGRIKPLTLGLIGCAIPQLFLFGSVGLVVYTVAICVFNFMYNMVHPYLYAALSSIDRTARIIKFAVAGQMLGVAIGPTIAATVVTAGDFTNVIYVTVVFFALALVLIIPPLINHNRALSKVMEATIDI